MRAVVYRKPFEVAVADVPGPKLEHPDDVLVRITSTCICGPDLHMHEGRTAAEPGIVFGHENLGIIEEIGSGVATLSVGDRVVMPFNVACGFCLTVNPGFAGGAYGHVARRNTLGCRTRISIASSCRREPNTRPMYMPTDPGGVDP